MILRQGLNLALAGLAVGAATAYGAARLVSGFLFQVRPADAASFVVAGALILVVCIGATLLPAWRATTITPMTALRRR
jgi:ABC-type lipoprotein release transport system permease subunit